MKKLLVILLSLALSSLCATAATIRVPTDQPTIQAGIDAATDGDTVLVADGTYTGVGNRDIEFHGKAITLRSENGPESCVIDAQWEGGESRRCFLIWSDETWSTVIDGFTVSGGVPGIRIIRASPVIRNCVVTSNNHGIFADDSSALIESTWVDGNDGAGIAVEDPLTFPDGGITVLASVISNNSGGGINCYASPARFISCLIEGNLTDDDGGGILCYSATPLFRNCTIVNNTAGGHGGGLCSLQSSNPVIENCNILGNSAATGDQYALVRVSGWVSNLTISYSNVLGDTHVAGGCHLFTGPGMIHEDPLFTNGPLGNYYLSQIAAGQGSDSPCVDSGNPDSDMIHGTTRTDLVQDSGVVDMGYHYPDPDESPFPNTLIISGPIDDEVVTCPVVVYTFTGTDEEHPASTLTYSWRFNDDPWSDWSTNTWAAITGLEGATEDVKFQVRARDPDGDIDPLPATRTFSYSDWDWSEKLARFVVGPGPGPGNPPQVRTSLGQWTAYSVMLYGVNVAAGDIDGDGSDEVITGPGPGAVFGPHVRCFEPGGSTVPNADFLAYGTNKYGVNVTAGDIDGDGSDEIITGAGPGAVFGPHVRGWNWDGGPEISAIPGTSYFAYGTLKFGVNVTCGDIDGDGTDEIITGAGPGAVFGPHVRGWRFDGSTISPVNHVNWFAFGTPKWGVNVACGDLDGDGIDEIITGAGPGPSFGAHVRAWDFDNVEITQMPGISYFAYPDADHGVVVGAADVDADGLDELLTMPGPSSLNAARLRAWDVDGGTPHLDGKNWDFDAFDSWMTHGGRVAGSKNGWE